MPKANNIFVIALFDSVIYIDFETMELLMFKKIKSYLRFWSDKPSYHVKGSLYGGLRMDIDKFYSIEENKKELEEINNTFGKMFSSEQVDKKELTSTT